MGRIPSDERLVVPMQTISDFRKGLLLVFSTIALIVFLCPSIAFAAESGAQGVAQQTGDVTRAAWITKLVDTFNITVENADEYPEDYFTDVNSSRQDYDAIMKAADFGIIDTTAGEAFNPDSPATRDFAAHTLNFCLGIQPEEGKAYTFSDSAKATYPDDLQIAVNRNWFALSGGGSTLLRI